jgi:endoribonuclease Nob1
MSVFVLDSSAFIQNYADVFSSRMLITTNLVFSEMKSDMSLIIFNMYLKLGMKVIEPKSVDLVKSKHLELCDNLSDTDISVLALAYDYKTKGAVVVTEDNSVKNMCRVLGLDYVSLSTGDVLKSVRWVRKCSGCGKKTDLTECPVCGSSTRFISKRI